jgi:hypothetical protein
VIPHPLGAFQHLDPEEQSMLTDVGARVCAPLLAGTRLLAIVDVKAADERSDDRQLLLILRGNRP